MEKAVIYARYSSDNQRDESIDAQIRSCRLYAQQHDMEIVHIYADRAISGTTDNRPQFQAMIQAAKRKAGFDVVLVHKLDRFSRDRLEAMLYKRDLQIAGVRLESTVERLGDDPESALMESIYFGMAEFYSRNLAREVRKGMNENALKGLHCGGMAPFGFRLNQATRKLEIEPEEADGVRMAFDAYLAGCSYGEIADRLNEAGYRTRIGRRFTKGSLHGMLINEKYCGRWYYGKIAPKDARKKRNHSLFNKTYTVIEGGCPAIVTPEVFDAAQRRLSARKKGRRCDAKVEWLLTGIVRCGCCGQLMHTQPRSAHGVRYYYYQCRNKECPTKSIPKELLEDAVLQQLDEAISPATKRHLASCMVNSLNHGNDVATIDKQMEAIEAKIRNLSKALADGAPWEVLAPQWDELNSKKRDLQRERAESSPSAYYMLEDAIEFFGMFGALQAMPQDKQREILHRNVREIVVSRADGEKDAWNLRISVFPPDAPQDHSCGACGRPPSGVPEKGPSQNESIKMSEIWSPKGFPNLARCFILSL